MPDSPSARHVHIDPVGGVAGDMFVAGMLDLFPDSQDACLRDLELSGVLNHVTVDLQTGKSHGLAVQRFNVKHKNSEPRATGHYSDLKQFLLQSALDDNVRKRALALLHLLAQAESQVHGVDIENVHFHEVADWDSVADIVAAASVIERNQIDSWSCGILPVGSGLVNTEHGLLPVPAPATQVLLEGLATWDDGIPGERVTPTGAAIVRYLSDIFMSASQGKLSQGRQGLFARRPPAIGLSTGVGAGQRSLPDRPNIVRFSLFRLVSEEKLQDTSVPQKLALDTSEFEHAVDQVAQLNFAIDDMTSEEVAVALQYIRQTDGVIDVTHYTSFGKKGRMMFEITVLCEPLKEAIVSRVCFAETSTLGMRVQLLARRVLKRQYVHCTGQSTAAGAKLVERPLPSEGQQSTMKVESDDLRRTPGLYARRERASQLAKIASTSAMPPKTPAASDG